jgi:putative inorganic carbon (hco3(-)) transporter
MRMPHPAKIPLAAPLSIFLLGGVLGLLASYDPAVSTPWLLWLGAGAALYIAIVLLARSPARLSWVAAAPVLAAALCALLLATQYRYLGYEQKFGVVARLGRLSSAAFPPLVILSMNANAAASCMEGALPLAIGLAIASQRRWRLAWGMCALTIAYGILLTSSRGAWVALAVTGLLGAALLRTRRRRHLEHRSNTSAKAAKDAKITEDGGRAGLAGAQPPPHHPQNPRGGPRAAIALVILGLAAVVALGPRLIAAAAWRGTLDAAAYRAADRLELYRNSFFLALDFPFTGIGPGGTFGMVYSQFQLLIPSFYLGYAHNLFLSIWLAQGLLGLLGFGGLLLASARLVWRGLVRGAAAAPIGWGATLGCTAVLLHGLTDAPQYDGTGYVLLSSFALFGVMVAAARLADARPLVWARLGPRTTGIAVALVVAFAAVLARPLLDLASANAAAIYEARSLLGPDLSGDQRGRLHQAAIAWSERGLRYGGGWRAALKERGMLALAPPDRDFSTAIRMLEPALSRSPADQSIRKALGYAYIWDGRVAEGVTLLETLDRSGEIRGELEVWPIAWQERGRPDLAAQARLAAALLAEPRQR